MSKSIQGNQKYATVKEKLKYINGGIPELIHKKQYISYFNKR